MFTDSTLHILTEYMKIRQVSGLIFIFNVKNMIRKREKREDIIRNKQRKK